MVDVISHRGPDYRNLKSFDFGCVGHARLTIIDRHERANQPFTAGDGNFTIVYNGEIYNFEELRYELSCKYQFVTKSDTEVLLAGVMIYGESFINRLNGMFAFCIINHKDQSILLARDRFGQKPLFYCSFGENFYFASEIKALFAAGCERKPNKVAWQNYLSSARVDEGGDTFFDNIFQLEPGQLLFKSQGSGLSLRKYYDIRDKLEILESDPLKASAKVQELMFDATRIHMRSDVPVGVSLSGGLDSSSVVSSIFGGGDMTEHLKCFSMEYGEDFSEKKWINNTVDRFNLNSHFYNFSINDFFRSIKSTLWHQEAPPGGLANCALGGLAALTKKTGVSVLQDGTGLDEAFGGYRNHHNMYLAIKIKQNADDWRAAVSNYSKSWGVTESQAIDSAVGSAGGSATAIDGTLSTRPDLLIDYESTQIGSRSVEVAENFDDLKLEFAKYLQRTKIPRNTRMKDRASMAHGVELRLPFLDHRLVEYALSLHPDLLFGGGLTKSIIRMAMRDQMDDVVRLAQKRSIQTPQGLWLKSEPMKSYIKEILNSETFANRFYVEPNLAKIAYDEFCKKMSVNSFFIWQWIVLEEWHRVFIDNDPVLSRHPSKNDF